MKTPDSCSPWSSRVHRLLIMLCVTWTGTISLFLGSSRPSSSHTGRTIPTHAPCPNPTQASCVLLPLGVMAFSWISPQIPWTLTVRKRRQKKNERTRNIKNGKLHSRKVPHLCYRWTGNHCDQHSHGYQPAFSSATGLTHSLSAVQPTGFRPPNHTPGSAEASRAAFWNKDDHICAQTKLLTFRGIPTLPPLNYI